MEGGEYIVQIHDGRVGMANGYYYPNIEVPSSPSTSSGQAISAAKSDRELTNASGESHSAELVVYLKEDGSFTLAWKTVIFAEQPFTDWLYYIDAASGAVIEKHSRLMDVTGDGNIFPAHPGISAMTTTDLYRLSGNGSLEGTYVDVLNDEGSEASSGSHDFTYGAGSTHFDEANLYYHVDDFRHNFISGLEYSGDDLDFTQITAHAHATHPIDGEVAAWFSPGNQHINFGDASTAPDINNFAREEQVIYHEYGHAVIYDIESGISSAEGGEEGAISEGVPDYFSGAHAGDALSGEFVLENFPQAQRDMANPEFTDYDNLPRDQDTDEVNVEAHIGGEFFSAILWDLRGSMSASAVDFLVYDALHGVTGNPTFLEFRDAMIAADWATYSGTHRNVIKDTFAAWGVGLFSPPEVTIDGPDTVEDGEYASWSADVSGGTGSYSYTWYKDGQVVPSVTTDTYGEFINGVDGEITEFTLAVSATYPDSEAGTAAMEVTVIGAGCIPPGFCP